MFRSGGIQIDGARRTLDVDGVDQHLEPQAFDLLVYLVSNADRVVPKAELLDEVWGDQFVSESALTTRVKEIRHALGDNGTDQRVIKNVRGRGYQFIGQLSNPASEFGVGSPLFGRDDDAAQIEARLTEGAVVTLVGPGGVGKTSLALDVARRAHSRLPDRTRVVELAQVREPDDVIHAIGLAAADGVDGSIVQAVAALDGLVVIDNGEHVIGAVATFVDNIVRIGGPVRLLITSRERIGTSTEQVWPLAPLDGESARRLLIARVQASSPTFRLESGDEAVVAELLATVDHLPLAIEMAAPHLAHLRPPDLLAALSDRIDLLRAPNRAVSDRHRSLPNLVDWSIRLLDDEARATLVELSVFAGPAALVDIAAVLGRSEAELALGALRELVDQSLLVADTLNQPTTYRMLETVRAHVASGRPSEIDGRHAAHVIQEVVTADHAMRTGADAVGAARIDSLLSDVRVAHRWAIEHDPVRAQALAIALSQYAQERQWPEPALWWTAAAEPTFDSDEVAALVAADAANRGDYETSLALATRVLENPDPRVRVAGHDTLANVAMYTGDTDEACRQGEALIHIGETTGDRYALTLGVLDVALGHLYGGDLESARAALAERPASTESTPTSQAWFAYAEGEIATVAGDLPDAVRHFDRAIELAQTVGNRFVIGVSEVSRLATLARGGELGEAFSAYAAVLERYRRLDNHTHAVTALRNIVVLFVRAEADQTAMEIVGALTSDATKSTYGAESEQLDAAVAQASDRHGRDVVGRWLQSGEAHDVQWALERAIDATSALHSGAK